MVLQPRQTQYLNANVLIEEPVREFLPRHYVHLWPAGFTTLLTAGDLTITDLKVLFYILERTRRGNTAHVTRQEISQRVGSAVNHISESIAKLKRLGAICQERGGPYRISPRLAWYGTAQGYREAVAEWDEPGHRPGPVEGTGPLGRDSR